MINTLIFDFGRIFIDLQPEVAFQKLNDLGFANFTSTMLEKNLHYEIGKISTEEFIGFYLGQFPNHSEETVKETWNSILSDFPKHRFDFIQKLSKEKRYKLILLSNTNALHIESVAENIPFFEEFLNCFDQVYYSHEIFLRKPDPAIFEFVLSENHLKPEECFFIDDLIENTRTAEQMGIKSWTLNPESEDVIELFDKFPELTCR